MIQWKCPKSRAGGYRRTHGRGFHPSHRHRKAVEAAMKEPDAPTGQLPKRHLEILQHALGVDQYGRGQQYRNHYCAGGEDVADCAELVALGYMRSFQREYLPYFNCTVTDEGKAAMLRESSVAPKLTRSQRRYRYWLDVADAYGYTFGEWLKATGGQRPLPDFRADREGNGL